MCQKEERWEGGRWRQRAEGREVGYHRGKKLPQSLEKQEIFVKSSFGLRIWASEQNLSYCSLFRGRKRRVIFGKVCVNEIACLYVFISFFKYPHVMLVEHVTNTTFTCV